MRCTTSATLPSLLALSLFALACSEDRTPAGPSGSTPKPKDASVTNDPDGGMVNPGMDATPNPGMDATPNPGMDATPNPGMDATPGNPDAVACACDQNPNACDQGCACDPRCMANPDGGVVTPDSGPVTPFDGGVVTGDTFNAQQRAAAYAAAICAHRQTCEPVFTTYIPQNQQQCEQETTAAVLSAWSAYVPLITAGRMAFSASGFTQCIQSYTNGSADCAVGPDPAACDNIFVGNRAEGAPCSASPECSNSWCALTTIGACGVCTAYAQAGDDCSQNVCAPGTDCLELNDGSQLCIPNTAGLNQPCGEIATGLCRGHLQCVGPEMGPFACTRPAAQGQACDTTGAAADCDIYANSACGANGTCGALNVAGPGTMCGMSAPTTLCNSTSRCDTATSQCVALPVGGGMCNATVSCARGFFCQPNAPGAAQGTCNAELATGTMCQASGQCAGNDYCISGSCGPLTFNPSCN
jgi:hypothetical protein